jgi:hypothetical protein
MSIVLVSENKVVGVIRDHETQRHKHEEVDASDRRMKESGV